MESVSPKKGKGSKSKHIRCPFEGCEKLYKSQNGLTYHLPKCPKKGKGKVQRKGKGKVSAATAAAAAEHAEREAAAAAEEAARERTPSPPPPPPPRRRNVTSQHLLPRWETVSFEEEAGVMEERLPEYSLYNSSSSPSDNGAGGGSSSPDSSTSGGSSSHVHGANRNLNGFTRLPVSDLWLFGVHPMREPLRLAICHKCGQRVLATALPKHSDQCKIPKKKWIGGLEGETVVGSMVATGPAPIRPARGTPGIPIASSSSSSSKTSDRGTGSAAVAPAPSAAAAAAAAAKVGASRPQKRVAAPLKRPGKFAKTADGADKPTVAVTATTVNGTPIIGPPVTAGPGYVIVLEPMQTKGLLAVPRAQKLSQPSPLSWRDRAQLRHIMDAEELHASQEGVGGVGKHGEAVDEGQAKDAMKQPALPIPGSRRNTTATTKRERAAANKKVAHKTPPPVAKLDDKTGEKKGNAKEPVAPPARTFKRSCPTPKCNGVGHRTGKFAFHFALSGCPNAPKV